MVSILETSSVELTLATTLENRLYVENRAGAPKTPREGKGVALTAIGADRFKNLTCYGCGKKGHIKANCWSKPEESGARPGAGGSGAGGKPVALMAWSNQACLPDATWMLDSGATHYMTFDRAILQDYRALKTVQPVEFGDGGVRNAVGMGDA